MNNQGGLCSLFVCIHSIFSLYCVILHSNNKMSRSKLWHQHGEETVALPVHAVFFKEILVSRLVNSETKDLAQTLSLVWLWCSMLWTPARCS